MNTSNLTFEQKIALLAATPPGPKKHELIQKLASSDTDFFRSYNAGTMPLEQYMRLHHEEFSQVAIKAKTIRDNLTNKGWTEKKHQKYLCELPERLYNERPEFSSSLPRKKLADNIRAFLNLYPMFRVDK